MSNLDGTRILTVPGRTRTLLALGAMVIVVGGLIAVAAVLLLGEDSRASAAGGRSATSVESEAEWAEAFQPATRDVKQLEEAQAEMERLENEAQAAVGAYSDYIEDPPEPTAAQDNAE